MEYRYDAGKVTVIDDEGGVVVSRTVATRTEANKLIRSAVLDGAPIVADAKKAKK